MSPELAALETFDFRTSLITPERLAPLPLKDLRRVRGIVFGRHGRSFKEDDIQGFLFERPWYQPRESFKNSELNEIENRNLDLIREAEARKHPQIEPGDLRFWRDQAFTATQLGRHSAVDLRIMRAEIEAIHGKRFTDDLWLQSYFEERYWYHAAESFDPKSLTGIERQNLATIAAAQKGERNLKLALGDMGAYQNALITTTMLKGLSLFELRLLRNEVYARHGKVFVGPLGSYFYDQDWYKPDEEAKIALNGFEQKNVSTIIGYEQIVHQELSTVPVTEKLLQGLMMEDARLLRNEIYARHGKVFKDRWLRKYFSSLAWYKPDPNFKDEMLSALERKNAAVILAYEKVAESEMSIAEG